MRISRRRHKEEPKKIFFYNEGIIAPSVFVLGSENESLGVLNTAEAIRKAREEGLDLVLINPKSDPPVTRIMDFGQFQYQQEKEARLRKAHQHVTKVKCVRLSLRIGAHDMEIRKDQAVEFLNSGDKVKVEVVLKGREMQQGPLGMEMVKKFTASVNELSPLRFDQNVERQGNIISAIIAKA